MGVSRLGAGVIACGLVVASLAGCSPGAESWAPAPHVVEGLSTIASTVVSDAGPQLALHTEHGDVTFWGGVNMGTTTPGHNPGELSVPAETYRRWLPQMAEMGIRFLRVYTILPPYFYNELQQYNLDHATSPLYLVQGVYLPDESYIDTGDLFATDPTRAFTAELQDASAAVGGDLERSPTLGRASGTWTADVTPWLAGWIIGAELDPKAVHESDLVNASAPEFAGTYFRSVADQTPTTPTERWLAARMDELATAEAGRGRSAPIAFVNWPTNDPLQHPVEANPREDLVGVDANHVLPTAQWPAGSFASYHAYPYYPDFLRFEPALQEVRPDGGTDAYLTYLEGLKAHHDQAGLPTMVTEFGVPASLGSAHFGTNGRDQGAHPEAEAMAMDAQMLLGIRDAGLAGALLFIWVDEWFKFTWNTVPRFSVVDSERRALWHDPLTNEQWFGVIATDPVGAGWRTPVESSEGPVWQVSVATDASYVSLEVVFADEPTDPFTLGFDIVEGGLALPGADGGGDYDVAVVVEPLEGSARAYVREDLNPILLDGLEAGTVPPADVPGWFLQRMSANRAVGPVGGLPARPAEFVDIGNLVSGTWDTESPDYQSMATWLLQGAVFDVRLPWSMLLMGDPSSKTAVVPADGQPTAQAVDTVNVSLDLGAGPAPLVDVDWEPWNVAAGTERIKQGADVLIDAWQEAGRPS